MTQMKGDIVNRVKRLPKPSSSTEALQPVFEAVSNAIHAGDDLFKTQAIKKSKIDVTVKGLKTPEKIVITVVDNGVGLDADRFDAFCTTDTDYKMERGGKGVGRLLWLDAFEKIDVASVYKTNKGLRQRRFTFQLDPTDPIANESDVAIDAKTPTGTTIQFKGLRPGSYRTKFPSQAGALSRHFGSHFFADFLIGQSPQITLTVDGTTSSFPSDVKELLVEDRGIQEIRSDEYGILKLHSFVCKKEASADFEGQHQLHLVAVGRTVTTRKIDGLVGVGKFGEDEDFVYHGCLSGPFLEDRVNQERTHFNFDEKVVDELSKLCATNIRQHALGREVRKFDAGRLETLETFVQTYPTFGFEKPEELIKRAPKNAVKPEQFAQALIVTRIRRDEERRQTVQSIVAQLADSDDIGPDFAEAIREAADDVRAEEQRQLTEYVLRRKIALDVLEVLIRKIRELPDGKVDYQLEKTLHEFICPMRVRSDDPSKLEVSDHDLWIVDERLAFAQYFASDLPFSEIVADSGSGERPDVVLFDSLHGMGLTGEDPLEHVMLIEFKKPGRTSYSERYSPQNQVARYLNELKSGQVTNFKGDRIRIADDCVFSCFVVADIVGELDVVTNTWQTTANGRGRWLPLSGKYRGSVEIIEWRDLLNDARLRNQAYISAAGLSSGSKRSKARSTVKRR